MRSGAAIAALAGVLVTAPAAAESEEQERRITVAGRVSSVSMDAFGGSGDAFAAGFGVGLAYGLRSWLDVGLHGGYVLRQDVELADPVIPGVTGSDLSVAANLHAIDAAATARVLGRWARVPGVHPIFELRLGLAYRMLTAPLLLNDAGSVIDELDAETGVYPFAAVRGGLLYRWGDRLQVGLVAGADLGSGHAALTSALELSWQSY